MSSVDGREMMEISLRSLDRNELKTYRLFIIGMLLEATEKSQTNLLVCVYVAEVSEDFTCTIGQSHWRLKKTDLKNR